MRPLLLSRNSAVDTLLPNNTVARDGKRRFAPLLAPFNACDVRYSTPRGSRPATATIRREYLPGNAHSGESKTWRFPEYLRPRMSARSARMDH